MSTTNSLHTLIEWAIWSLTHSDSAEATPELATASAPATTVGPELIFRPPPDLLLPTPIHLPVGPPPRLLSSSSSFAEVVPKYLCSESDFLVLLPLISKSNTSFFRVFFFSRPRPGRKEKMAGALLPLFCRCFSSLGAAGTYLFFFVYKYRCNLRVC